MKNGKRILAWIGIIGILALFAGLVASAFLGASENVIFALLFCVIVIPVMIYAYMMIIRVMKKLNQKEDGEDFSGKDDTQK